MMKNWKRNFGVVVLAVAAVGAGTHSASAQPCGTAADRAAVVQAVKTMFVAAAQDNVTLFHSVASPDFYAFDNGKQYRGDELMGQVQQLHAAGHVFVWKVTEPRVHADCHIAGITEINVGSIDGKPMRWLESGLLRKTDGKWRVEFFHSSRVPEAQSPHVPTK